MENQLLIFLIVVFKTKRAAISEAYIVAAGFIASPLYLLPFQSQARLVVFIAVPPLPLSPIVVPSWQLPSLPPPSPQLHLLSQLSSPQQQLQPLPISLVTSAAVTLVFASFAVLHPNCSHCRWAVEISGTLSTCPMW